MDLDLQDKSVIVTGGASNIGRAIALGFAAEGAKVTIADLDAEAGERVAKLALKSGAAAAQVVKTDVTDLASVQALFQQAEQAHGGIHCLVNNVGWDKLMFFTQTTPELWQKNLLGDFGDGINRSNARDAESADSILMLIIRGTS